jgi:hypothetical protein
MNESWAPDACTLPTAERPFRVAEFDQLFAAHLRHADRVDAQTLDLTLDPASRPTVEDLTARETECCSFFTFTLSGTTDFHLRITVPPAQTAVLDGILSR